MKCICGYEEPEDWQEEVEVLFQSGPRKGQVKEIKTVFHDVKEEDKFLRITVEKGFDFVVKRKAYGFYSDEYSEACVGLYACPKCHTVKMYEY